MSACDIDVNGITSSDIKIKFFMVFCFIICFTNIPYKRKKPLNIVVSGSKSVISGLILF
jgi:hypothetical protein